MVQACSHCGQLHEASSCPAILASGGVRGGSTEYRRVTDDEALLGSVVANRYRIREILGQGSTGTVFAVEHVQFARKAAMKVLRPQYASPDAAQKVLAGETRAAFAVSHPSLCEVFDIGTLPDGAPFFVMERLYGQTLSARLRTGALPTVAAVDVMMQLLSAMSAVHAAGLLFRDVRPQNLYLVRREGCRPLLKVLDFGLARLVPLEKVGADWDALRSVVGDDPSLSAPFYLSPERARGDENVGPASDIFAASVVFFEMLSGGRPFSAPSWDVLMTEIDAACPPPLAELLPELPATVAAIVTRALSREPERRPPSAREMQAELGLAFDMAGADREPTEVTRRSGISDAPTTKQMQGDPPRAPSFTRTQPIPTSSAEELAPPSSTGAPTRDLYSDDTRTERNHEIDLAIAARQAAAEIVRIVLPGRSTTEPDIPVEVDADADLEEATARDHRTANAAAGTPPQGAREDEETETMELTPALRARIEQMAKTHPSVPAPAPTKSAPSKAPPATKPSRTR